ncbi:MAG: hypothetical protein Q7S01_00845 [bacterium]|nr:hypothetical protein [bacterium]
MYTRVCAVVFFAVFVAGCGEKGPTLDQRVAALEKDQVVVADHNKLVNAHNSLNKKVEALQGTVTALEKKEQERAEAEKEKEETAEKAAEERKAAAKKAAKPKTPSAATIGKWQGRTDLAKNPIARGNERRGLPSGFVKACDVKGKPGVKGYPINFDREKNTFTECAEIVKSTCRDPLIGKVETFAGLCKMRVGEELKEVSLGDLLPQRWVRCQTPEVEMEGTKLNMDAHFKCIRPMP